MLSDVEIIYRASGLASSALPLESVLKALIALAVEATSCEACRELVLRAETPGALTLQHGEPCQVALATYLAEQMSGAVARARLREEVEDLKRQLENRKLVERAKGILQRNHNLTEEQAYLRLKNESRRARRPLAELAQAVILAETVSRTP